MLTPNGLEGVWGISDTTAFECLGFFLPSQVFPGPSLKAPTIK